MGVEVGHGEGIDDRFLEFFNDGVETSDVCLLSVPLPFSKHRC